MGANYRIANKSFDIFATMYRQSITAKKKYNNI